MRKIFLLVAIFTTVCYSNASAQKQKLDPAARLQQMKERIKPQLMEKTKLNDAQADKVVEIRFNTQSQVGVLRDLSEDDRKKKIAEMQAETEKQYKDIPLTDEQVKAVNEFFEEMRKNMQQRRERG